jgi:transcriptional regulator with XRE-family HTH domain
MLSTGQRRVETMGKIWELLQRHIDNAPYPPSERAVAHKLGVSPTTLGNWKDPKKLPSRENLQAIADLVGVRYSVVLDAALYDTGYHEGAAVVHLRRPATTVQAELHVAELDLADFDEQDVPGSGAQSHRVTLQARVDALRDELVASRNATAGSESVAKL